MRCGQTNVFVVDEYQKAVTDCMIEPTPPAFADDVEMTVMFHSQVIQHVHKNKQNAALHTFFFDQQRLF